MASPNISEILTTTLANRTKKLADNLAMFDRYRGLIAANSDGQQSSDGEHLLKLLDLVRQYDGRSWFAGFAKTRLTQRRIDETRKQARDPLLLGTSLDGDGHPDKSTAEPPELSTLAEERWSLAQDQQRSAEKARSALQAIAGDLRLSSGRFWKFYIASPTS